MKRILALVVTLTLAACSDSNNGGPSDPAGGSSKSERTRRSHAHLTDITKPSADGTRVIRTVSLKIDFYDSAGLQSIEQRLPVSTYRPGYMKFDVPRRIENCSAGSRWDVTYTLFRERDGLSVEVRDLADGDAVLLERQVNYYVGVAARSLGRCTGLELTAALVLDNPSRTP